MMRKAAEKEALGLSCFMGRVQVLGLVRSCFVVFA